MVNRFGEAMQAFNHELIECIEDLKATKSSIDAQIEAEEAEKVRLQREVERMSGRISQLNESLGKKSAARVDYDRTIQETESAYVKILESSQLLLNMVKREAACLDQTLSISSSCTISERPGDDLLQDGRPSDRSDRSDYSDRARSYTELLDCCDAKSSHKSASAALIPPDNVRKKRSSDCTAKT